jgi:hypothetical protein
MPERTTIREVVEGFEAQIVKAPALGVTLSFLMTGPDTDPNQRAKVSCSVRREISRNLDQTRNQDRSRFEDLITVRLMRRIRPKAQLEARNDAYDLEESIVKRLTELTWERRWNVRHLDTREILKPPGEWLILLIRFSVKRYKEVGTG